MNFSLTQTRIPTHPPIREAVRECGAVLRCLNARAKSPCTALPYWSRPRTWAYFVEKFAPGRIVIHWIKFRNLTLLSQIKIKVWWIFHTGNLAFSQHSGMKKHLRKTVCEVQNPTNKIRCLTFLVSPELQNICRNKKPNPYDQTEIRCNTLPPIPCLQGFHPKTFVADKE